jgi:hypothetical protein
MASASQSRPLSGQATCPSPTMVSSSSFQFSVYQLLIASLQYTSSACTLSSRPPHNFTRKRAKLLLSVTKLLNISPPIPNYVTMQGHISKSPYTRKQRKEFLRTWTAIGRAHVSASYSPDLFQLLDIASSSLVADHDCDDCGPLCIAHPSSAGSQLESSRPPTAVAMRVFDD